jgi:hypothetical protein
MRYLVREKSPSKLLDQQRVKLLNALVLDHALPIDRLRPVIDYWFHRYVCGMSDWNEAIAGVVADAPCLTIAEE